MSDFLKKHKKTIIFGILIVAAYFVTRLINLTLIPIFTDEAIYLRWSQIMAYDASLRFLPLVDGKPPLFMWLTSITMRLLPTLDPLISGRLVSVFAGFLGLCGIVFTSYLLFKNKKISFLTAILYLLTPFTLFYDRFALADSLLAALGIWSLGLGVLLVRTGRLDIALILGFVIGLARLTKSPSIFFLFLLPLLVLLRKTSFLKLIFYFILIAGISEMVFSILRLFPLFNMLADKNAQFTITLSEFLKQPFGLTLGNLKSLFNWEFFYLTPLVFLTTIIGIVISLKKYLKETLILVSCFLLPVLAMATFNKIIYARYLLTFTPVLLILAAVGLSKLKPVFAILVFAVPVYISSLLLTKPLDAPIPDTDRGQYMDGWAAGYGIQEIRQFLTGKTGVLATEGTFGLMPYALEIYQQKYYPNLAIKAYWPLPEKPTENADYLLMYQNQKTPGSWKLEELFRFRQGKGTDYLRLYKVL
ncbi:MAG: glycosyltransferase family 39 protein [Patescibacteria group bacterium]